MSPAPATATPKKPTKSEGRSGPALESLFDDYKDDSNNSEMKGDDEKAASAVKKGGSWDSEDGKGMYCLRRLMQAEGGRWTHPTQETNQNRVVRGLHRNRRSTKSAHRYQKRSQLPSQWVTSPKS